MLQNRRVTSDGSFKEWEQMRLTLEPLAYQYGVDIFTNGLLWPPKRPFQA